MQATEPITMEICGYCHGKKKLYYPAPFEEERTLFGDCPECGGTGEDLDATLPYVWHWGKYPQTELRTRKPWQNLRKGHRCRVLVRGRMRSVLIEFEDGYRMVSSHNGLRRW